MCGSGAKPVLVPDHMRRRTPASRQVDHGGDRHTADTAIEIDDRFTDARFSDVP